MELGACDPLDIEGTGGGGFSASVVGGGCRGGKPGVCTSQAPDGSGQACRERWRCRNEDEFRHGQGGREIAGKTQARAVPWSRQARWARAASIGLPVDGSAAATHGPGSPKA
jgi:hypothetical protein